jgi:oligopeptide transport system substrate-binding protein
MALDTTSITAIENLFVHLTNYDLETAQIVPEGASEWHISDDGLTYTFEIRTDIPWVKHDPLTGETVQAVDGDGRARFLSAYDFVYAIKRACDPATGAYYSSVIAPQIKGCADVLFAEDPKRVPKSLWNRVGVSARDDSTLVIELEFPAGYFLSMTPMWTLAAVPEWAIAQHGKYWTQDDNIVTNGRFVLHEWVPDVSRTFVRNPLMPEDMRGQGNIESFEVSLVPDHDAGYALWLDGKVDISSIPDADLQTHLERFPEETDRIASLAVHYVSFRLTKPPFDDVRVRRAFSAAFDRETFVDKVLQGQGLPMIHFAPPGIFGAPPIDEVGLGFDPDFARQQLADAGYPNCRDFPQVTLAEFHAEGTWTEYAQAQWKENLGCSEDQIQIVHLPFRELMVLTESEVPDAQAPHMWTMGWGPDYADENNWVGDVLWCKAANRNRRTCSQVDELIVHAREEPDPGRRIQLYRQIEEMFFGPEGEIPFFPISVRIALTARHAWLERTPALFGGDQWYNWTIDQSLQHASQR